MMQFKFTSWGRIPTLAVKYTAKNGKPREGYLTPFRKYGFQVCVNLQGDSALGLVYNGLREISDAAGGYQRIVLSTLAYGGLSEWAETQGVSDQMPNIRYFTRNMLSPASTAEEEKSWTEIQKWITASEDWIETSKFTPGEYTPE